MNTDPERQPITGVGQHNHAEPIPPATARQKLKTDNSQPTTDNRQLPTHNRPPLTLLRPFWALTERRRSQGTLANPGGSSNACRDG